MDDGNCRTPIYELRTTVLKNIDEIEDDKGLVFLMSVPRDTLKLAFDFECGMEREWNDYEAVSIENLLERVLIGDRGKSLVIISLSKEFLTSFFEIKNYDEWMNYVLKEKREKEVLHTVIEPKISPYSKYPPTVLAEIPREFLRGAFIFKRGVRLYLSNPLFYDCLDDEQKLDCLDYINQHVDTSSFLRVRGFSKEQN